MFLSESINCKYFNEHSLVKFLFFLTTVYSNILPYIYEERNYVNFLSWTPSNQRWTHLGNNQNVNFQEECIQFNQKSHMHRKKSLPISRKPGPSVRKSGQPIFKICLVWLSSVSIRFKSYHRIFVWLIRIYHIII